MATKKSPPEMLVTCNVCDGEGIDLGEFEEFPCHLCDGQGIIDSVTCDICQGQGCPRCDEGILSDIECPLCEMTGIIDKQKKCPRCRGWKVICHPLFLSN